MNDQKIVELAIQGHASTREAILWAIKQEREECAKVCESLFDMDDDSCNEAEQCAKAIRARGLNG